MIITKEKHLDIQVFENGGPAEGSHFRSLVNSKLGTTSFSYFKFRHYR